MNRRRSSSHRSRPTRPSSHRSRLSPPSSPRRRSHRAAQPTEQYTPPGYAPPSSDDEAPSAYRPPTDYQQPGYPPPAYPPPPDYPPPPSYPTPGAQQPGYPPPYPDPSTYGGQSNYGAPSYPPPPPPPYGTTPGYPPPSSYPATGYSGGYGQPQAETNQFAIWSLVASLVGLVCCIGSIVGIVLGVLALNQIKETRQGGHGLAVAGIAVGVGVADHQHHLDRRSYSALDMATPPEQPFRGAEYPPLEQSAPQADPYAPVDYPTGYPPLPPPVYPQPPVGGYPIGYPGSTRFGPTRTTRASRQAPTARPSRRWSPRWWG